MNKLGFYSIAATTVVMLHAAAYVIFTLVSSFLVSDSSETSKVLVEFGQPTINSPSDVSEYLLENSKD